MRFHLVLCTAISLCCSAGAARAEVILIGSSSLKVFVNLIPVDPIIPGNPIVPPDPIRNLNDPIHPTLTTNVTSTALFSFGMQGLNGETFTFGPLTSSTPLQLGEEQPTFLLSHTLATGSGGTKFDVYFDASYTDQNGQHPGFIPGNPVHPGDPTYPGDPTFPPGSFALTYALSVDPPFTVGVFMLNPADGNTDNPVTFTSAVPEPSSLVMFAGFGLIALAGWRRRLA